MDSRPGWRLTIGVSPLACQTTFNVAWRDKDASSPATITVVGASCAVSMSFFQVLPQMSRRLVHGVTCKNGRGVGGRSHNADRACVRSCHSGSAPHSVLPPAAPDRVLSKIDRPLGSWLSPTTAPADSGEGDSESVRSEPAVAWHCCRPCVDRVDLQFLLADTLDTTRANWNGCSHRSARSLAPPALVRTGVLLAAASLSVHHRSCGKRPAVRFLPFHSVQIVGFSYQHIVRLLFEFSIR